MKIITILILFNKLQWRHNELGDVSNHQPHDCLLSRLFRPRSKKSSKLRFTGLCEGNSPETGEIPAQRPSNAENVFIWWRHHEIFANDIAMVTHNISTTENFSAAGLPSMFPDALKKNTFYDHALKYLMKNWNVLLTIATLIYQGRPLFVNLILSIMLRVRRQIVCFFSLKLHHQLLDIDVKVNAIKIHTCCYTVP